MATEIERKFLVKNDDWRGLGTGVRIRQGYLCADSRRSVRVRLTGDQGILTIKGAAIEGQGCITRLEYEVNIPYRDAEEILERVCQRPIIEKTRYRIPYQGAVWEVDEFSGANQGLVVAEIELDSEEQSFVRPPWIGREVSDDPRYLNSSLASHPWCAWPENQR